LTIKIDETGVSAIANIDRTNTTFKFPKLDTNNYIFNISQSTSSEYSQLIITKDGKIYLNGKVKTLELIASGETCGWAPPKNSRNSSAAKAPENSKELPISEKIFQILTQNSYQVKKNEQNRIILSHNNSPILSITTEQQPKLYLIPENNLELIFQRFQNDCYIFKNDQTDIEIWICKSGQIIFQQNGTNIRATFTHQNISELLDMQLFYFKFTEIYALLYERFVQNGSWNNTLRINEREHPKCCFFEFEDNRTSIEFKLKITYDHIQKEYKYFIVRPIYNENMWELWKDRSNQNEYITNVNYKYEYKINLATKQIFKINTSDSINEKGIFELKWSLENLYHWDKDKQNRKNLNPQSQPQQQQPQQKQQQQQHQQQHRQQHQQQQQQQQQPQQQQNAVVNKPWTPFSGRQIVNNNFSSNRRSNSSQVIPKSRKRLRNQENDNNDENYNNMPPLIPINQKSTTIAPSQLVPILQQSNERIRVKNIKLNPENIPELFKKFVLFKGIDPKSQFDKLFIMNNKGMPVLHIEFHGIPYKLTWNNSTKLIKINSSNKTTSKIENVTNQLKFLDKCDFISNVKNFTDFFLTFNESNNTIIYDDTSQKITLTSNNNNTFISEKCTIFRTQGYLWYDTDDCEKMYFIVNYENIYCYQNGEWKQISKYPQKLIDLLSKRNYLKETGKLSNLHEQRSLQRSPKRSQPNVSSNNQKLFTKILLGFLQQKSKNKLSLIPKTQSTDLNPNLLQSVKDLLSNLPNLSKNLNQPPLNITAQISPNLFLIPYGETSILVAKQSNQLFPFPLLYRDGFYYCKLGNLTLKIIYYGSNYVFELKNEDGSNVPINPKLIGYNNSGSEKSKFTLKKNNNKKDAVEISNNISDARQITQSAPKIELTNTLQKISRQQQMQSRSILPSLQNQLRNMRSQILPVNPQSSLKNTELIAKISENIMVIRRLNKYYVVFIYNGQQYEHELIETNNLLYCKNCSIQIQGEEKSFNFAYNLSTNEYKIEPIVQKRISNNRTKKIENFTNKLVELEKEPMQIAPNNHPNSTTQILNFISNQSKKNSARKSVKPIVNPSLKYVGSKLEEKQQQQQQQQQQQLERQQQQQQLEQQLQKQLENKKKNELQKFLEKKHEELHNKCFIRNKNNIDEIIVDPNLSINFINGQYWLYTTNFGGQLYSVQLTKNGSILSTTINDKKVDYDLFRCKEEGYNPFKKIYKFDKKTVKQNQHNNNSSQSIEQSSNNIDAILKKIRSLNINILKNKSINNIDAFKNQIIQNYNLGKSKIKNKKLKELEEEFIKKIKDIDNIRLKKYEYFNNSERIGPQINFTVGTNNNSAKKNNVPLLTQSSNPSLKNKEKKLFQIFKSPFSKNPHEYTEFNRENNPSFINTIKSTMRQTGSFIKDKLEKVIPKKTKSPSQTTKYSELVNNNENLSSKQFRSPTGYSQLL
jgi:hypothetical protein